MNLPLVRPRLLRDSIAVRLLGAIHQKMDTEENVSKAFSPRLREHLKPAHQQWGSKFDPCGKSRIITSGSADGCG